MKKLIVLLVLSCAFQLFATDPQDNMLFKRDYLPSGYYARSVQNYVKYSDITMYNKTFVTPTFSGLTALSYSSAATSGTVRTMTIDQTHTGDGAAIIEALKVNVASAVQTGSWANAIVGRIAYSGANGDAGGGLAAAICGEVVLPAISSPAGQYFALDLEFDAQEDYVANSGSTFPTAYIRYGLYGNATAISSFEDDAYFMHVSSDFTSGTGNMLYNNTMRIQVGTTDYFIPLSTAENSYTSIYPISGSIITAQTSIVPDAADGAAIGTAALEWSDAYFSDASVLYFGADQDVSLTHVADTGLMFNAAMALRFRDAALNINSSADGQLDIDADTEIELTTTTVDLNGALDVSGSIVGGSTISVATSFDPDAADGATLGTAALEFSDLYLADAGVIYLGNDQDVTLTHVADTGFLLNDAMAIQFRDAQLSISSSADGQLDIDADTEIEITTTTLDLNGALDVSGNITMANSETIDNAVDGTIQLTSGVFKHAYDVAAYWTATQADGGGVTLASVSDGTAGFTFSQATTFSSSVSSTNHGGTLVVDDELANATYIGKVLQSTFTFTADTVNIMDHAAAGAHGKKLLFTFPEGFIKILGSVSDISVTCGTDGLTSTATYDYALGSEAAGIDNSTLAGTEQDIINVVQGDLSSSDADWNGYNATDLTLDGHTTPSTCYLNIAFEENDASNNDVATITGTITISWINLGDY